MTSSKIESTEDQTDGFDQEEYDQEESFGMVQLRVLLHFPQLTPGACMAYVAATTFAERSEKVTNGRFFPRKKTWAQRAHLSKSGLDKAIQQLKDVGLITQQRRWQNGGEIASLWHLHDGAGELRDISADEQGVTHSVGEGSSTEEGRVTHSGGEGSPTQEARVTHSVGTEQTRDQTTSQTKGSDHVGTPSLATASPNESARTSTKLSKGGRAAVLAEKDKARENRTHSLAELNPDWDAEPSWSLFLAEFTARAEREGMGWTIQDWVAKDIKATITTTLMYHESRDKVDRALVKCAREAKAPYSEKAVKAFLGTEFHGPDMTVEEREQEFGPGWMDKAPVEPSPTVVIPEQRQATMDAKPRTEAVEPVEVDVDVDEDDGFLIRPEGLDDIEVQDDEDDQEPEDDVRPMLNFETPEDEPLPVRFEVPVIADVVEGETFEEWSARQSKAPKSTAPRKPRTPKPVVDTFEGLPWGTDEEIVTAVWPDGVRTDDEYALAQSLDNWLVDFLIAYRKTYPDQEQTARMDKGITTVSRRVAALAAKRAVKVESEFRLDPVQALRARLREKVAA
ncbi:hypothetical protein ACFYOT_26420 [Saccharothrix saharensis]|uniref:hypothetical protein n=1 Tax=Saccharothrix saharensis TaxID=571190 RepID=UPI0036BF6620